MQFSRSSLILIVSDLISAQLVASRGRDPREGGALWSEATYLDERGLDLDSLERVEASSALNEYFHLHEYGAEDTLLSLRSLGEWCDLVEQSLAASGTYVTFRTSGATGVAKRVTHRLDDLAVEADIWATMFGNRPIVSLVPAHHIYGTMFSALLPDRTGASCTNARWSPRLALTTENAVVVGTPTMWRSVARAGITFPSGITGITSTAPMPSVLATELHDRGLATLIEIYGSTETAGIGLRTASDAPFTLLNNVERRGDGVVRRGAAGDMIDAPLMDVLHWADDRNFTLAGRYDEAVQVGGHNVHPARVREVILAHPEVEDVQVRLDGVSTRLKAFVVPKSAEGSPLTDKSHFAADLDRWCAARLSTTERPRRFDFGDAVPLGPLGKPVDW